jgi:hypothetical protein
MIAGLGVLAQTSMFLRVYSIRRLTGESREFGNIRGNTSSLFDISLSDGFIDLGLKLLTREVGNALLETAIRPLDAVFHYREHLNTSISC